MLFLPRLLFAAALVLVFLTSWIVLPAPSRLLVPLGVGAPELSGWLALGCLAVGGLTLGAAGRDTLSRSTLALAAGALVLASMPLVQLPFAVRRFDSAMRRALGDDFLRGVPSDSLVRMRSAPIVPLDLFKPFSLASGSGTGDARVTRGVLFATPRGVPLTLDIYRPASAGRYPSVVQIYGGAWQRGAPGDDAKFAAYLANRGFVVFAIDYRHAPEWQWPAQIEDVRAALGWIREHGSEWDADVSRLALLGRSAGAQLAMVAAYDRSASRAASDTPDVPVQRRRQLLRPRRPGRRVPQSARSRSAECAVRRRSVSWRNPGPGTGPLPRSLAHHVCVAPASTFTAHLREPRPRRAVTIRGQARRSAARRGRHLGVARNSMGRACVRPHCERTERATLPVYTERFLAWALMRSR